MNRTLLIICCLVAGLFLGGVTKGSVLHLRLGEAHGKSIRMNVEVSNYPKVITVHSSKSLSATLTSGNPFSLQGNMNVDAVEEPRPKGYPYDRFFIIEASLQPASMEPTGFQLRTKENSAKTVVQIEVLSEDNETTLVDTNNYWDWALSLLFATVGGTLAVVIAGRIFPVQEAETS